jgi:hypothetical protein
VRRSHAHAHCGEQVRRALGRVAIVCTAPASSTTSGDGDAASPLEPPPASRMLPTRGSSAVAWPRSAAMRCAQMSRSASDSQAPSATELLAAN